MRRFVAAALLLSITEAGCQRAERIPTPAGQSPGETAARVFALAQRLENEGKTKEAFATYHQIVRQFPDTPDGKQAAGRILQAQRDATRKARQRKSAPAARKGSG